MGGGGRRERWRGGREGEGVGSVVEKGGGHEKGGREGELFFCFVSILQDTSVLSPILTPIITIGMAVTYCHYSHADMLGNHAVLFLTAFFFPMSKSVIQMMVSVEGGREGRGAEGGREGGRVGGWEGEDGREGVRGAEGGSE